MTTDREDLTVRIWRQVEHGVDVDLLPTREKRAKDLAKKLDRELDQNGWRMFVSGCACQRHGEMSRFRQDKMSHFLHVKRLQPGWLPRSSLALLLLHRDTEHPRLAPGLEPVALALDVDRCRVV